MDAAHDPNLTALWCRAIAEELHRSGIARAVLCPGSRNGPLLHALHAQLAAACLSHVDERSAGFLALGMAKQLGQPVAVCVTSGSALANLLPAATEAHAAGVPLILISADRPWEAHDASSPQTMRQQGLFGHFVRHDLLLGEPIADDRALRSLRARVCWLVHHSRQDGGPVHLNVPLRDPLTPARDPAWSDYQLSRPALIGRAQGSPAVRIAARQADGVSRDASQWRALIGDLPAEVRGLIVAGQAAGLEPAQLDQLALSTGYPLIADAPGGLRERCTSVIATADALVSGPVGQLKAELIIQAGPGSLARSTYEYLDRQHCPWLVLAGGDANPDFLHRATAAVHKPGADDLKQLADILGRAPEAWRSAWQEGELSARRALRAQMQEEPWGEVLAAHLAVNHPGFALLHVASSMAVRHANLHCLPGVRLRPITANRGLNGIDGTLGTFLGELAAHPGNGLLLIGDLAALHDLPALAAGRAPGPAGAIVVINNDGGGIFDFLSVAQLPAYRQLVRTPHGMDFSHIAGQFGLVYHVVDSPEELARRLDQAALGAGLMLIECQVDGDAVARHRSLIARMAGPAA